MIYLDNNTTTQTASGVFDAMKPYLDGANNSNEGAVEKARESVARLIGAARTDEIFFTSSGTESNRLALDSFLDRQIITTRVEHGSIRSLCETRGSNVTWLDVAGEGVLDIDGLRAALNKETAIVSVMLANDETGVIFPVEEIAKIVKESSKALFHVDGSCAAGKIPVNLKETEIDLFSLSGHKFHGPDGIGALYIREGADLKISENRFLPEIVGIGAAAEFVTDLLPMTAIREMRERLENAILEKISNTRLNGPRDADKRLPNTSYISFENTNGEAIMAMLDAEGIRVWTGSACRTQDHVASAVLQAMNIPYVQAMGAIRFSLGRNNTAADIETVIEVLPGIVQRSRDLGH